MSSATALTCGINGRHPSGDSARATSDGQIDCVIDDVKAGGPADKAGLQRGDRVLALEQQTVRVFHDLVDALKQYNIGDTVTITVERLGKRLDVDVKLEPWALPPVSENAPLP